MSLPGYGFSDRPNTPGMDVRAIADIAVSVMEQLGYDRFAARGSDLGAGVLQQLALAHPERFPLEITRAPLELLLRVPGIGPGAARTLVQVRRHTSLRDLRDVRRIGVDTVRAGFYLTLRGRRLVPAPAPHQLRLFAPGQHLTQAPFRTPVPPCAYR